MSPVVPEEVSLFGRDPSCRVCEALGFLFVHNQNDCSNSNIYDKHDMYHHRGNS
jgi:hypothetical protein